MLLDSVINSVRSTEYGVRSIEYLLRHMILRILSNCKENTATNTILEANHVPTPRQHPNPYIHNIVASLCHDYFGTNAQQFYVWIQPRIQFQQTTTEERDIHHRA